MTNKISTVGLLVATVALVLGFVAVTKTPVNTTTEVTKNFGAVSTLDGVDNPNVSIGGQKYYYYSAAITATSSNICSIKITATSTLSNYSILGLTNGLGSQLIDVSTSTTAYGTSSPAFVKAYSTGTTGFTLVWGNASSTTLVGSALGNGSSNNMLFPGEYLNAKIATSSAGTFSSYITGSCSGLLRKL